MYRTFETSDASMLEINPLVVTGDGKLVVLDCKFNVDDNALFRHKDLAALRDDSQEDPAEREAPRSASTTSSSTALSAAW